MRGVMNFTEQERKILRRSYQILDYKLGTIGDQVAALERQIKVMDTEKEREGQKVLDRTRIVTALKAGTEFKIDVNNPIETHLFVRLKDEELIDIIEMERKQYIAKWRVKEKKLI